jgi:hypothetical protein
MVFSGYHNALLVGLSRLGHWDSREAEAHTSLNLPEQQMICRIFPTDAIRETALTEVLIAIAAGND